MPEQEQMEKQAILPLIPLAMGALALYSGYNAVRNVQKGNYGSAALDALGVIPGVGIFGKGIGLGAKALGMGARAGLTAARAAGAANKGIKAVQGGQTVFRASNPVSAFGKGLWHGTQRAYGALQRGDNFNVRNMVGAPRTASTVAGAERAVGQQAAKQAPTPSFLQPQAAPAPAPSPVTSANPPAGFFPKNTQFAQPAAKAESAAQGASTQTAAPQEGRFSRGLTAAGNAAMVGNMLGIGGGGGGGADYAAPFMGPQPFSPVRGVYTN